MSETINPKSGLYKKILAVQKVLDPLEKTGWNDFQKYNYSTASDVLLPVQRACNEQGLVLLADCVESKIEPGRASVIVRLSVADCETGESLSVTSPGYAEDFSYKDNRPNGDKAVYKAITGATKYAVRSCFCLPSDDDPERTPQKLTVKPSGKLTIDRTKVETAARRFPTQGDRNELALLIEQTTAELERLGWSSNQGRLFLQDKFGKSSRQQLSQEELQQFLDHLRSLPLPTEPQPVLQ